MPVQSRPSALVFAALAAFAVSTGSSAAQAKVDVKEVTPLAQQTPKFDVSGVKEKRWKPKTWLELEVAFELELAKAEYVDALTFRYYIVLDGPKEKQRTLVGDVTHINVPVGEEAYAVIYISPATIKALTESEAFSEAGVKAWGVEVLHSGQLVGGKSSNNKKWWEADNLPYGIDGKILNKKQTPFAPLWGDYHVDVQPGG